MLSRDSFPFPNEYFFLNRMQYTILHSEKKETVSFLWLVSQKTTILCFAHKIFIIITKTDS